MRMFVIVGILLLSSCCAQESTREPISTPESGKPVSVWKVENLASDRLQAGWEKEFSLDADKRTYQITLGRENGKSKTAINVRDRNIKKTIYVFWVEGAPVSVRVWVFTQQGPPMPEFSWRRPPVALLTQMLDRHASSLPPDVQEQARKTSQLAIAKVAADSATYRDP